MLLPPSVHRTVDLFPLFPIYGIFSRSIHVLLLVYCLSETSRTFLTEENYSITTIFILFLQELHFYELVKVIANLFNGQFMNHKQRYLFSEFHYTVPTRNKLHLLTIVINKGDFVCLSPLPFRCIYNLPSLLSYTQNLTCLWCAYIGLLVRFLSCDPHNLHSSFTLLSLSLSLSEQKLQRRCSVLSLMSSSHQQLFQCKNEYYNTNK